MTKRTNKQPKLFVWDFHGTLEEGVEVGFFEILKQLAKEYKTSVKITLSEVRKKYGVSVADYLRYFFPECNTTQIKAMMKKVAEVQNQNHLKSYVTAAPYAIGVLTKIKEAGHKNIVVSNSHPKHITPLIKIVGMRNLIDDVFGIERHYTDLKIDVVAEKAKSIKNYAQGYEIDQIIVIGDKPNDIDAGLVIGARTYQYINPDFPNVKTDAHYKITNLREILKEI